MCPTQHVPLRWQSGGRIIRCADVPPSPLFVPRRAVRLGHLARFSTGYEFDCAAVIVGASEPCQSGRPGYKSVIVFLTDSSSVLLALRVERDESSFAYARFFCTGRVLCVQNAVLEAVDEAAGVQCARASEQAVLAFQRVPAYLAQAQVEVQRWCEGSEAALRQAQAWVQRLVHGPPLGLPQPPALSPLPSIGEPGPADDVARRDLE